MKKLRINFGWKLGCYTHDFNIVNAYDPSPPNKENNFIINEILKINQ